MNTRSLLVSIAACFAVVALTVARGTVEAQTTVTPKCVSAATAYQKCVNAKYAACFGKTGTALANCMKEKAKTGGSCNAQSLMVCLSANCQQAVTSFQTCLQTLKTACSGKKDKALVDCLKAKKVETSACNPANASACASEVKKAAQSKSSARSTSSAKPRSSAGSRY